MAKIVSSFWKQNDHPVWAGDFFSRDHLVPAGGRLDTSTGFVRSDQVVLNLTASTQPQTTLTLENPAAKTGKVTGDVIIPNKARLRIGPGHYLQLTAEVKVGDTTIAVESTLINTTLTEDATYDGVALLVIPSGTLIGRTFAEDTALTPFGSADDADDIMYLIPFPIQVEHPAGFGFQDIVDTALYRHNSVVKENQVPDFATLSATKVTYIRANYTTQQGVV